MTIHAVPAQRSASTAANSSSTAILTPPHDADASCDLDRSGPILDREGCECSAQNSVARGVVELIRAAPAHCGGRPSCVTGGLRIDCEVCADRRFPARLGTPTKGD